MIKMSAFKNYIFILLMGFAISTQYASALSETEIAEEDLEESARFAYLEVTENGLLTTFNASSMQYLVVTLMAITIVGVIVLPLINIGIINAFERRSDNDLPPEPTNYYNTNYGDSSYTSYRKR